jgi:hypothetical protein
MKHKAMALILSCIVIVVLVVFGAALLSKSVSENNISNKYTDSANAFWAAEAGLNMALVELRNDFTWDDSDITQPVSFGSGEYTVTVTDIVSGKSKKVVVSATLGEGDGATRQIEAIIEKDIPTDFFDHAVYTAGDLDINGTSFTIDGDVVYGGEEDIEHPENITGTSTQDPDISPLARFNFPELLAISLAQTAVYASGNVYDVHPTNKKLLDPITGSEKPLPTCYWYYEPDSGATDSDGDGTIEPSEDGLDNDGNGTVDDAGEDVPNVVYIQGDLKINGNIGTVGGFLVVVGDVITNPDETYDASVVGEGVLDGVLYTLGEFDVNGGGATGFEVNGGVWAGEDVTVNGSAEVVYNSAYMQSIGAMNIEPVPQVTAWRDSQNTFPLQ